MLARRLRFNRTAIANQAIRAATTTRSKAGESQADPICIYDLCDTLGIRVHFNDINMEGMYQRGHPPRIHVSALRPMARRVFNCAHELGHHVFGHGSSIDELREEATDCPWQDPNEFLADTFAGFILMPTIGLRRAFSVRNWTPETATASQLFTIACEFGVGYATLLTQLSTSVKLLSRERAKYLGRQSPRTIREDILQVPTPESLVVVDHYRIAPTVDIEEKTLLLLPPGTRTKDRGLVFERDLKNGRLFRAEKPGIFQVRSGDWVNFVRIAPVSDDGRCGYVGLAKYRHLEDNEDE